MKQLLKKLFMSIALLVLSPILVAGTVVIVWTDD